MRCTTLSISTGGISFALVTTMKFQDYYEALGVARDASAEQIKKAFRKLARK